MKVRGRDFPGLEVAIFGIIIQLLSHPFVFKMAISLNPFSLVFYSIIGFASVISGIISVRRYTQAKFIFKGKPEDNPHPLGYFLGIVSLVTGSPFLLCIFPAFVIFYKGVRP